ncbi:MAG TPA: hypothetical protein VJS38_05765, partial [Phenylobacterium sp.]|uniref:portal protein n=1 Tax=Phenylobacterium sp. TaxID=1871053 RepID=UPI002B4732E2
MVAVEREREGRGKLRYTEADLLRIVDDECRRSVGFGEGDTGELARVRIKAQEYRQGKIVDLQVIRGRSTAVDSTLSDAVDTLMPDVMEVFFGGDDVVTFQAVRTHYLRIDADGDGQPEIWRIETDGEQRTLLQKEQVRQIPFGAL